MSKNHKKYKRKNKPHSRLNLIQRVETYIPIPATGIKLKNVSLAGFALTNELANNDPNEKRLIPILVRGVVTSDDPLFYVWMEGVSSLVIELAKKENKVFSLDGSSSFTLIIHKDSSADLYVNGVQMQMEILAKRDIESGELLYGADIADIRRIKFHNLTLLPSDKIFTCFKIGWKFGLLFDLQDNRELDVDKMERELAMLYRGLRYESIYSALADEAAVARMTKAGWFPFIQILGGDFDPLLKAYQTKFNIEAQEVALIAKFDDERIDTIAERWWRNPILQKHRSVLQAGLDAFKRNDPISCIKNIATEMEGVLSDLHVMEKGEFTTATKPLIETAVKHATEKAGGDYTLFLSTQFLSYLKNVAYADFKPNAPAEAGVSRHGTAHGAVTGEAYTLVRALQTILTLDQIAFYL